MSQEIKGPIEGVMTVGVPVSDQERAVEFYTKTLGLEKRRDVPLPQRNARWIEVAPAEGTVTIALVAASESLPTAVETGIRLATADAGAAHAQLKDRGVAVGDLIHWSGVPAMFRFHDPDGNALEIVESR